MQPTCGGTGVQTVPSQKSLGPTHWPPAQTSLMVHGSESLQGTPSFGVKVQAPVAGLHVSFLVQGLSSTQFLTAPDRQTPFRQLSFSVQKFPSSHGALLYVWTQLPVLGSHESSVQGFWSSQLLGTPAMQFALVPQ